MRETFLSSDSFVNYMNRLMDMSNKLSSARFLVNPGFTTAVWEFHIYFLKNLPLKWQSINQHSPRCHGNTLKHASTKGAVRRWRAALPSHLRSGGLFPKLSEASGRCYCCYALYLIVSETDGIWAWEEEVCFYETWVPCLRKTVKMKC